MEIALVAETGNLNPKKMMQSSGRSRSKGRTNIFAAICRDFAALICAAAPERQGRICLAGQTLPPGPIRKSPDFRAYSGWWAMA
jgi:hypothetical protein